MIQLYQCQVEWIEGGATTRFPDGTHFEAYPHDTDDYSEIAHRCGYGEGYAAHRLAYCREHELCHALMDREFRGSSVIRTLAQGVQPSFTASAREEALVQMFQRWLRSNERPILIAGCDWDAWKAEALKLIYAENARSGL